MGHGITYLDWTEFNKYIIPKSSPAHSRKNLDYFFIGSEVTAQTRLRMPITLWPMTSRHLMRRKKCDDFLLLCSESFPTIYKINDFAAIISSRYYTLIDIQQKNSRKRELNILMKVKQVANWSCIAMNRNQVCAEIHSFISRSTEQQITPFLTSGFQF